MSGPYDPSPRTDAPIPERRVDLRLLQGRRKRHYIPPVPLGLFDRASRLPRKALAVYLVLWRLSKLHGSATVRLTGAHLRERGVTRQEKRTALRHLQAAGLIAVDRDGRRNPTVTLLATPDDEISTNGATDTDKKGSN